MAFDRCLVHRVDDKYPRWLDRANHRGFEHWHQMARAVLVSVAPDLIITPSNAVTAGDDVSVAAKRTILSLFQLGLIQMFLLYYYLLQRIGSMTIYHRI